MVQLNIYDGRPFMKKNTPTSLARSHAMEIIKEVSLEALGQNEYIVTSLDVWNLPSAHEEKSKNIVDLIESQMPSVVNSYNTEIRGLLDQPGELYAPNDSLELWQGYSHGNVGGFLLYDSSEFNSNSFMRFSKKKVFSEDKHGLLAIILFDSQYEGEPSKPFKANITYGKDFKIFPIPEENTDGQDSLSPGHSNAAKVIEQAGYFLK